MIGKNITNARFIQVNQLLQIDSLSTAKLYVDNSMEEPISVRNNQDNDFNNHNLNYINSNNLNTQTVNDNQVITRSHVDQFHSDNERSRRGWALDFYIESSHLVKKNQDNDFKVKKLTKIDPMTVNRKPTSDNEVANKQYVDDSIRDGNVLRFNQH